jgi:Fe-S-cluster containining protein
MAAERQGLRRDLEDGLRFLHVLSMQHRLELLEVAARLSALTEELAAGQMVDLARAAERQRRIKEVELERMHAEVKVDIGAVEDKYALADLPQIDCEARLPFCKARCCSFDFELSGQDLDERVAQWDYARPYHIRRRAGDRYCVHNAEEARRCTIYAQRPAPCRRYDCRSDPRIWIDFDRCIPAPVDPDAAPSP